MLLSRDLLVAGEVLAEGGVFVIEDVLVTADVLAAEDMLVPDDVLDIEEPGVPTTLSPIPIVLARNNLISSLIAQQLCGLGKEPQHQEPSSSHCVMGLSAKRPPFYTAYERWDFPF